ncbi:hypothetical protein ACMWRF_003953 [Enterobacter hormaechei]|uniref:hypothetical protein n=1 Tax=Enterobacter hormaechei TaxID=158836 RepID=UPI001E58E491|nr:hypothetical protein [Enterobacter hormaechei]EKW3905724.1 hypothetical protein [Enterobacter hormaechei]MCB4925145.1 hypothetical protein [Enterobacter hormaechei]
MSISNNTNATFSFDEWEKNALSNLGCLQIRISKALLKYQGSTDKTAVGEDATRYMSELRDAARRIQKATPAIQQKVDEIVDMLCVMAQFSGITFDE